MKEFEEYKKVKEPNKKEKCQVWETAIGLQQVDGLKPSKYLIKTAKSHIEGDITIEEVQTQISTYYKEKCDLKDDETKELEADIVSSRIAEILLDKSFSLSYVEFISIHKRLFNGIYDFAGLIRTYNVEKEEWILSGKSVTYGNFINIKDYLEYDLETERNFSYKNLSKSETLNHIANFTSKLWQIHAFGEGNTRTVAVFLIKYLNQLGFNVDNTLFSENSWYFRNSLVRANFNDYKNNIYSTNEFLIKFLENLLYGGQNKLKNRFLHISNCAENNNFDTVNDTVNIKFDTVNDTVFLFIKENNHITVNEISNKTGKSLSTIKRKIKNLKDLKFIERVGSDKTGFWKVLK